MKEMIQDIQLFINAFSHSIVKYMTPHLYLSILPWGSEEITTAKFLKKGLKVKVKTKQVNVMYWNTPAEVKCISVSPDGKRLVTALANHTCVVCDTITGVQIGDPFVGHNEMVNSVVFSS